MVTGFLSGRLEIFGRRLGRTQVKIKMRLKPLSHTKPVNIEGKNWAGFITRLQLQSQD